MAYIDIKKLQQVLLHRVPQGAILLKSREASTSPVLGLGIRTEYSAAHHLDFGTFGIARSLMKTEPWLQIAEWRLVVDPASAAGPSAGSRGNAFISSSGEMGFVAFEHSEEAYVSIDGRVLIRPDLSNLFEFASWMIVTDEFEGTASHAIVKHP